ncbi:MAG: KamA family radical SAM protein [SAR324 cluster bacterium]|nr:KamA family radical SAM protein [SAR324 cluster bacterium]
MALKIKTRPSAGEDAPLPMGQTALPTGQMALRRAVKDSAELAGRLHCNAEELHAATAGSRLRVPEYYLSLIQEQDDAIWRQAVPTAAEQNREALAADPFAEDDPLHAPVPHLTHRYPDRALLLVTGICPMYCRFCMRKRKTLHGSPITPAMVARGIEQVRRRPAIREVILSGGDPLMLPDARLAALLDELAAIEHVQRLRIHTRMPCVEPGRITVRLAELLAARRPLTVGVHFNHPREITPASRRALALLADAGLPLVNQAVLLKGVNDDAEVLAALFRGLMRCRVHPYYLHHSDLIPGTAHFRLSLPAGMAIVRRLRELAPDLSMLHYVLDTPGGGGKVPLGAQQAE